MLRYTCINNREQAINVISLLIRCASFASLTKIIYIIIIILDYFELIVSILL